jgi:hypothetical protein
MSDLMSCEAIGSLVASGAIPWRADGYECITREQSDLSNPDRATAQTMRRMAQLTSESIATPRLHQFARKCAVTWRGGPPYGGRAINWDDERQLACSIWYGVNSSMRFVEHSEQIRALLNERDQLQLLISPDHLLSKRRPQGDCAVYTPLVCASLATLGIHYEFVTLACDPRDPDLFTHVYARAVNRDGSRLALDASHGKYPGWEVPLEHQIRKQVWNEAGEPIADEAPHRFQPLGQYSRVRRVMPRRIVGMGQIDTADTIDTSMIPPGGALTPSDIAALSASNVSFFNPPGITTPPTFPTGTATPGFSWDQLIGNLLGQGVKIAGQVVAPQTTLVRGPGGQLYYQAPASAGGVLPAGAIATSGGGNWLLIGGAVLIGIIAISALGKR